METETCTHCLHTIHYSLNGEWVHVTTDVIECNEDDSPNTIAAPRR